MKLVLRLLDASGRLLGWTAVEPAMKGDACLRAKGPIGLVPDKSGRAVVVSIHWTDVNVETRVPCELETHAGTGLILYPHDAVLMQCGDRPGALPPVTIRGPLNIAVPVGAMGAQG